MLEPGRINEIVSEIATATLSRTNVERVMSTPTVDSRGEDALRITIVIKPEALQLLKGNPVLDILLQIQQRLQGAGEERFPIVEYSTPEELDDNDGRQS